VRRLSLRQTYFIAVALLILQVGSLVLSSYYEWQAWFYRPIPHVTSGDAETGSEHLRSSDNWATAWIGTILLAAFLGPIAAVGHRARIFLLMGILFPVIEVTFGSLMLPCW